MSKEITKKYSNGEITVVWKPALCTHSTNCWRGLGQVFDPKKRPWVNIEGATSNEIAAQVDKCPSGALSYFRNGEEPAAEETRVTGDETVVEVSANGPLIIHGTILVKNATGEEEVRSKKTSFCRCGHSGRKPYCDGTHNKAGFTG